MALVTQGRELLTCHFIIVHPMGIPGDNTVDKAGFVLYNDNVNFGRYAMLSYVSLRQIIGRYKDLHIVANRKMVQS